MKRIVIFASGSGSNAEKIIAHFKSGAVAKVEALFCNRENAAVVEKARQQNISVHKFNKVQLTDGSVLEQLQAIAPDIIVLAGFLLMIPSALIQAFPRKIINIHPALLPKFGGHGMYGMNVHNAVAAAKEPETGITIHYVDEHYDNGDIIAQYRVALSGTESCEEIAAKVLALEHQYYPLVIEELLEKDRQ